MKIKDWIFLLFIIGAFAFSYFREPRLAYVRSEVLVNEFVGMQEARQRFQEKQREWQVQLDTLRADYQRAEAAGGSSEELRRLAGNLQQYSNRVGQLAEEEDDRMTQAVLNQINAFVETYGEEKGYDLIVGTTQSGNLLYGRERLDITDELLEALNGDFNPLGYGQ